MSELKTTTAHGKTWSLVERPAFKVEVLGTVPPESAEALKAELLAISERYGIVTKVRLTTVLGLSPEDQAEFEELDRLAMANV